MKEKPKLIVNTHNKYGERITWDEVGYKEHLKHPEVRFCLDFIIETIENHDYKRYEEECELYIKKKKTEPFKNKYMTVFVYFLPFPSKRGVVKSAYSFDKIIGETRRPR